MEFETQHKRTYLHNRYRLTDREQTVTAGRRGGEGRTGLEFGISRCKLLYIK